MIKQFTFGKKERLTHRNQIDSLFNEGKSFNIRPIKVFYQTVEPVPIPELKTLIAVPKKRFKRAVDRNRLRRLIREAYRLNRTLLLNRVNTSTISLHIAFVYIGDKADIDYINIEKSMTACLERLEKLLITNL